MKNPKNNPTGERGRESSYERAHHGKEANTPLLPRLQDCLGPLGSSDAYMHCPHCGCPRLYLVRREVFVMALPDSFRLVQDWFDPQHSRMYIDHDMRYGFGGSTTILHYICGGAWSHCPPFSIRLGRLLTELALRRSAPDIEQYAYVIRQAHFRGSIDAGVELERAFA